MFATKFPDNTRHAGFRASGALHSCFVALRPSAYIYVLLAPLFLCKLQLWQRLLVAGLCQLLFDLFSCHTAGFSPSGVRHVQFQGFGGFAQPFGCVALRL